MKNSYLRNNPLPIFEFCYLIPGIPQYHLHKNLDLESAKILGDLLIKIGRAFRVRQKATGKVLSYACTCTRSCDRAKRAQARQDFSCFLIGLSDRKSEKDQNLGIE
jgi:hypothetical protein